MVFIAPCKGRGHWLQSQFKSPVFFGEFVKLFLSSSPSWSLRSSIAKAQWPNNTQASFRRGVNGPKAILNFGSCRTTRKRNTPKTSSINIKTKTTGPNMHLSSECWSLQHQEKTWNCFCVIGFSIRLPKTKQGKQVLNKWHLIHIPIYLTSAKRNCSWFFADLTIFQAQNLGIPMQWTHPTILFAKMKTKLIQWLISACPFWYILSPHEQIRSKNIVFSRKKHSTHQQGQFNSPHSIHH